VLDNTFGPTLDDKVSVFLYFAIIGGWVIFVAALVYGLFFLSVRFILRKISLVAVRVAVYVLYGCLYGGVVLWIEWHSFGEDYTSLQQYLQSSVNYLAIFLLVIVVELGVLMAVRPGLWLFWKKHQQNSLE
jgi:hypothetical protein